MRGDPRQREVVVVHRPRYGDWSLPKGKVELGETHEAAARREVLEETGVEPRLGTELRSTNYRDRHGRPKRVRWWLMSVLSETSRAPDHEVDEVRWIRIDRAAKLLSHDADRRLVDDAVAVLELAGDSLGPEANRDLGTRGRAG